MRCVHRRIVSRRLVVSLFLLLLISLFCSFFFFNDTATTEIYTLSLHDALPIYRISTRPSATWKRMDRPLSPPPASPAMGIAAKRSAVRAATMLRSPLWTEPGGISCANMLAPPGGFAPQPRGSGPTALGRATKNGT